MRKVDQDVIDKADALLDVVRDKDKGVLEHVEAEDTLLIAVRARRKAREQGETVDAIDALQWIAQQTCTMNAEGSSEDTECIETEACCTEWCLSCYAKGALKGMPVSPEPTPAEAVVRQFFAELKEAGKGVDGLSGMTRDYARRLAFIARKHGLEVE